MQNLDALNAGQKEAVLHTEGPLLIVAGAGAGKTKTIVHRIIHLIEQGNNPASILAVTFTNKAAKEMRERVEQAFRDNKVHMESRPHVSTFHSLGVLIIKENHTLIGLKKHFSIADEGDVMSMIKEAVKECNLDPKQYEPKKFRHIISRKKGDFVSLADFTARAQTFQERMIAQVWQKYEDALKKEHALDFDDLLLKTVQILKNNIEIRKAYQERWKYIHIDEYQDTNEVQYELSKLLVGPANNICAVGDGDQNIYSWRGANIKNILNFEKDYKDTKVVLLEQNYRSTKTILEAANEVIRKNIVRKDKNLFTENGEGEKIALYEAYDEADEADGIANFAKDLILSGVLPDEIAVLYRANFQSRVLEEAFMRESVPYQVLGVKFFERKEIKDVISYLKASLNRESLSDIKRIINFPARGIGKATLMKVFADKLSELPAAMQKKIFNFYQVLDEINEYSKEHNPSETLKFVIQKSGIEDALKNGTEEELERLENIRELVTLSLKYDMLHEETGDGLERLIEEASLSSDQDSLSEKKEGVKLMTVHASKGLEFAHVSISGLEQDLFPHKRMGTGPVDAEEERRLFYVALTRARKSLHLSYASIRTIFGSRQISVPSEFLYDIPEYLIEKKKGERRGKVIYLD